MSRAFVKEQDGLDAFEDLPDKLISEHPNLVTTEGLAAIDVEVARLQSDLAAAQGANDRAAISRASRDLRYWSQRQASAELMPAPANAETVQFGSTVGLVRSDKRRQTFRIVGEDEADPAKGTLSYVSPLAQALMGKRVGDEVRAGASDVEITEIT
ncbi:MAG: transcription elongation factor GreA [Hyphomicrobium sp.]